MKNNYIIRLFLILIIFHFHNGLFAQQPILTEREIIIELEKRGLDRDEVLTELISRGIDVTTLEDVTPEEIQIIEEVILEMEKQGTSTNNENLKETEDKLLEMEQDSLIEEMPEEQDDEESEDEEEMELPEAELYGQDIFRKNLIKSYIEGQDFRAPDTYILGAGDEIAISIWGRSQVDQQYTVSKDGYIDVLGGSKRIFLKGITLEEAKQKIKSVLSSYYKFGDGEMDVTLNYARVVRVNIYGEVFTPGSVTLPAINNAFNALASSYGPNNLGSVRLISLHKSDGRKIPMDIYKYMNDPSISDDLSINDNDIILVPVAEKIVTLEGAVKRPMKYELLEQEGIIDLLKYAGGPTGDAYLKTIRVSRFENDKKVISDINYRDLIEKKNDFVLFNGDLVFIDTISTHLINFINVEGEVDNPGTYQRTTNMRISNALSQAGLRGESRTDIAFIKRKNEDGTFIYEEINIDEILKAPNSEIDLILEDEDLINIWAKERFVDEATFAIDGAVRYPDSFSYDVSSQVRFREAVIMAGGLRTDASDFALIHRKDPLNPKIIEYLTINNLSDIISDPLHADNIKLNPFDSIYLYSDNTFLEESFVTVQGAVNNPGRFQFGKNMQLRDLLVLAGGFKMSAATNNVEISRVIIKNNEPTNVVVDRLNVFRDLTVENYPNGFELNPFDKIAIRFVPEFELQESVVLKGEIQFPGAYAIISDNEKISSILSRAGGPTSEAFLEGASLFRAEDEYGAIVIKLNDSKFDFIVRGGDTINIPKKKEFVTIRGATNVREVLSGAAINAGNEIHVPYHVKKNALFYINQYAGGFNKDANKRSLVVKHPNGEVKRLKNFGLFAKYPIVKEGSVISVTFNTVEDDEEDSKKRIDWSSILNDSVGQAMSILTLLLLISRLD